MSDTLLTQCRAACRGIELEKFSGTVDISPEQQFRTKARHPWYEFCQNDKNAIMPFRQFWHNEETYQRTISRS